MRPDETGALLGRDGHLLELGAARWIAREEIGEDAREVASHLASCDACARYLDQLREDDARIRATLPPLAAPATRPQPRRVIVALSAAFACAAAIGLWLRARPGPAPEIRVKGRALELVVYAHDGTRDRPVGPGDLVRPGERLGFEIAAASGGYLMIFGVDGTGRVYACYPQDGDHAARLGPTPALTALPAAVVLDDVSGRERVVAVLCPTAFRLADVEAAARDPAAVPAGCTRSAVELVKGRP